MSSLLIALGSPTTVRLQRFFWLHPEWWSLALCWSAWGAMLFEGWQHLGHGAHHWMSFPQEVASWMLMAAAMMLPLVLYPLRATAGGSLWGRRHRAIAGFLVGFFAPWLALGLLAAGLRQGAWAHTDVVAALFFAAAALWQRTSLHWRAVMQCHTLEPLAPLGWQADRDCLRFGALTGGACVLSCWPLMLACALTGHSPIAMAGGMAVGISERWYHRPRKRTMLAVTLGLTLYYLLLAGFAWKVEAASPQTPAPETVGSTDAPFSLGKSETWVTLAMHLPADAALRQAGPQRRVFLNIEKMFSEEGSGAYDVYLNLPQDSKPAQRAEWNAGELPMFGLAEASRADAKRKAQGLSQHLEITDVYSHLASMPGWDPKRLTVTFVPRYAGNVKIQVDRVTVSMARR